MMNRIAPSLALLASLASLAACGGAPEGGPADAAADVAAEPATPAMRDGVLRLADDRMVRIGVRFGAAEAAAEMPLATVPATVAPPPNARVAVAAVIPGVVTRTLVVEGETVRAGQPLAIVAAREMFALAAGIDRASARVAVAQANERRLGQLAREGVIAGARADEARAGLSEARAELAEQRRVVGLVNGSPASGTYTLAAPIAGTVTSATIQTGSPVDGATAAYVVDAASRYELTAQLPERLVGQVRPGMAVMLPGGVRGAVTSVGSVVDPQTRSAMVRARIPAAPGIVSGRSVAATLLAPAPAGTVTVRAGAVVTVDGRPTLFVRVPGGVAPRVVDAGETVEGRTVIRRGLRAGDSVAVAGTSELKSIVGRN